MRNKLAQINQNFIIITSTILEQRKKLKKSIEQLKFNDVIKSNVIENIKNQINILWSRNIDQNEAKTIDQKLIAQIVPIILNKQIETLFKNLAKNTAQEHINSRIHHYKKLILSLPKRRLNNKNVIVKYITSKIYHYHVKKETPLDLKNFLLMASDSSTTLKQKFLYTLKFIDSILHDATLSLQRDDFLKKFKELNPEKLIDNLLSTVDKTDRQKYITICKKLSQSNLNFTIISPNIKLQRIMLCQKIKHMKMNNLINESIKNKILDQISVLWPRKIDQNNANIIQRKLENKISRLELLISQKQSDLEQVINNSEGTINEKEFNELMTLIEKTFFREKDQINKNNLQQKLQLKVANKINEIAYDIDNLPISPTVSSLDEINEKIESLAYFNNDKKTKLQDKFEAKKQKKVPTQSENDTSSNTLNFINETINNESNHDNPPQMHLSYWYPNNMAL